MRLYNKNNDNEKDYRQMLISSIVNDFLDGSTQLNGYIGRKIKYSNIAIIDLYTAYEMISLSLFKVHTFENYIGRINYIFKSLEENYNINKGE